MSSTSLGARAQRKASTREALLEAARRCFGNRGWSGTAIGDIARDAGVAHGTFYVHFESKEAVADALLDAFNADLHRRMSGALAGPAEWPAKVRALARVFLRALGSDPGFVSWYAERAAAGIDPGTLREGVNPRAVTLLAAALSERGVRQPELVAHGLLALWLRVGLRAAWSDATSAAATEDLLVSLTVGALGAVLPDPVPERRVRE